MKKLILLALSALLLAGCSDARASIKNGKETIFSVGDQSLTKGEMYNFMLARDAAYYTISEAKKIIFEKEVPVTDEMKAQAQSTLDSYQIMFGGQFLSYLQSYGFTDEQDYLENSLIPSLQSEQLTTVYVKENFDALVSRYSPKKIQIMQFTNKDTANAALAAVQGGADFTQTATDNGSLMDSAETIATTQSSYPTNVLSYLTTMNEPTLSEVIPDDSDANFYIVKVVSATPSEFSEEAAATIGAISAIASEASIYYFKKYNFTVYDKTIYDQLESNYSDYLVQAKLTK